MKVMVQDGVWLANCTGCGKVFEQPRKQGRPRTKCDTCSGAAAPRVARGVAGDPPVRADGRCVVCLKPRKLTKQARRYAGAQLDIDPFDSTSCCRKYHGCELDNEASESQVEAARDAAVAFRERTSV